MRLFIAEKPELAKAIVEGLGGGSRKDGYFDCGSDCVTWCFGHMLELCDPEDYDEKYAKWNINDLPISHVPWKKKVSKDKKKQVKIIVDLIKNANIIVNAGDPDEEGQLLVDEIIEYSKSSVPVKRVLINDNNTKVVQKSLANLRDNAEFHGFSQAAEARSVGDQLYGYNLSRAYTLKAQEKGMQGVLSVGRVQTPVLGMVVRRERENKAHKKAYYYNVNGVFDVSGCQFPARYQVSDSDTQDDNGRLIDEEQARKIATAVSGQSAKVVKAETKNKKELAPLPYNLLKLQTDASRKFGYKPDQVKQITQDLREKHKLITYNRSDCEYLSDEQHADAQGILSAIATTAPLLAKASTNADPNVKGRAFNSSKVSAHHAIIPTEATANFAKLSEPEQKIYMLIARQYIAQFWPDRIYEQTILELDVGGHIFSAIANVTIQQGFKVLYKNDQGNEDLKSNEDDLNADLRSIKNGDIGRCIDAKSEQKETKPPALYTIATLLSDLTRVAKYIKDERLKKLLIEKDKDKAGEHGGIGTPATRDTIIKGLFDRGFLSEKGKSIVATELGHQVYDALPESAVYPDMSALWHEQQKEIQTGSRDAISFVEELMDFIGREVEQVKVHGLNIKVDSHPCPDCGKPLFRRKGSNGAFWGCSGFPECKTTLPDLKGRPGNKIQPANHQASKNHSCKECGEGLIRRKGKKKGSFWWGCSGFPKCKQMYSDMKGAPKYT